MPSSWTWDQRSRRIRRYVALGWTAYVVVVVVVIALVVPSYILQSPGFLLVLVLAFVMPPAWINVAWVYFPGYLFGSNGMGRLVFNEIVQAQISRNSNIRNGFGVPKLPTDLRTSIPSSAGTEPALGNGGFALTRVVWDQYLYISSAIVFDGRKLPSSQCRASLEFSAEGLIVRAGRWRPGRVLELPYSTIIGVWNGSDIKTIDSGGVLVVVVAAGQDELLLPFEVVRVKGRPNERRTAKALVRLVEQHRNNVQVDPRAIQRSGCESG